MNDFTKKELIDILECVRSFKVASIRGSCHYYDALNDKVEFMIDNYREYNDHDYYREIAAAQCKQCKMVILP